jgi:lysyl-tRNA synthetase class 2
MALSEQEILRREALTELRNLVEPYPQPNLLQPRILAILADFEKYEGKKLF